MSQGRSSAFFANQTKTVFTSTMRVVGVKKAWLVFLVVSSILISVYGFSFWAMVGVMDDPLHNRIASLPPLYVVLHTVAGGLALLVGAIQFLTLTKARKFHRYLGRIYVVSVFASALGGGYMAADAFGGWVSTLGLGLLDACWIATTFMAVVTIRSGNIERHREWILRSFALTFAAVTLRIELPILAYFFGFEYAQIMVYWLCWTVNLIVVELWLTFNNWRYRLG